MKPIQKIAFVVNAGKPNAYPLAESLVTLAENHGVRTQSTDTYPIPKGFLKGYDACCVIGGDGTFLSTVNEAVREQVPILGINMGKLGFLATFSPEDFRKKLLEFLKGNYVLTHRAVLHCRNARDDTAWALNDVVIKQLSWSRLLNLSVYSDQEKVHDYSCDGLIFSTPTGSTAYNLSADGPIIHPSAQIVCMTPICPHTLSNRSIIFPHSKCLKVLCPDEEATPQVAIDGKINWDRTDAFPLEIRMAEETLPLLQDNHYDHFDIIRNKLNWSA